MEGERNRDAGGDNSDSSYGSDDEHGGLDVLGDLINRSAGDVRFRAEIPDSGDLEELTFDINLPMQHTYLGNDLTVLTGRTLLDDDKGSSHWIQLFPQEDLVLVPGQTLPLSVFHQPTIQMMNRVLEGNRIFGTVCVMRSGPGSELKNADVGTTAEIYEVQVEGSNLSMRMKAIGRQRFKILETKRDPEGFSTARVKILPEVILPNPLAEISCQGLGRYRTKGTNEDKTAKRKHYLRSHDSIMSVWPSWVYEQYDAENLVKKMLAVLSCHKLCESVSPIPTDPVELSFWVARSLPIKDSTRLVLLRMNSAVQRLRWELFTLEMIGLLCCCQCNQIIANQQDVFSMSAEGLQGTYCNEYGYVYETITIHKASGLLLQTASPSTEYSWFPGYAWRVAACSKCGKHMGWLFTATSSDMKPRQFWGLCRRSLRAKLETGKS